MYSAGWNMPGYLPETDPETFDTIRDAWDYLIETRERWGWDDETDATESDVRYMREYHAMDSEGSVYGSGDSRNIVFWVQECEDMRCDSCEALMINGVYCHETGCPNRGKEKIDGVWTTPDPEE